ncbi:MAG TPA: hypothetical protein VN132_07545 [Bdellovibrio sp.]|nr:hypothetical protein [Bdellovibrio sp.]
MSNSEFRNAIESLKGLDFSLPVLDFSIDSSWSGTVENLCLDEVDVLAPEDGFAVGCTMALFAWLGISDLHRENLKIGFRVLQLARALVRVNNRQDFEEQFGETKVSVEGQQLFFVSGGLKLKCNWT